MHPHYWLKNNYDNFTVKLNMNTSPGNIAHSESVIQERLAPRQYGDKIKHFEEWIRIVHLEELVDEDTDEIDYQKVSAEILKQFLGHISKY